MKRMMMVVAAISGIAACGRDGSDTVNRSLPPVTMLSPDTALHIDAQFSPDGKRLFWWHWERGTFNLWTADSALGGSRPVGILTGNVLPLLWSPDGASIAAPSSKTGLLNVVLLSATGEVRPLADVSYAIGTGWHPDGDRFTYLTTIPAAGEALLQSVITSVRDGGAKPLLPDETNAAIGRWTRDGAHVVFIKLVNGRSSLWVADSTGRNARPLTTDGFESPPQGEWFSPDGKMIAYMSRRTGTSDIWVAAIDGSGARQLTRDVREDYTPRWSPDGKSIAFISQRGKQNDIWMVPSAGGEEVRVTDDAAIEELVGWLPGGRLAFLTGTPTGSVWSTDLASGGSTRLTHDSIVAGRFTLSPDGSRFIVFIERGGGASDLAVVPATGGTPRILVSGGANTDFIWSPAGNRFVFSSTRNGSTDIWLYDLGVDSVRQLTTWPDEEYEPTWNGDGSAVYFISNRSSKVADVWRVPVAGGEPVRLTTAGGFTDITSLAGDSGLYAGVVAKNGEFHTVKIAADGTLIPLRTTAYSSPWQVLPGGDSLIVLDRVSGVDVPWIVPTDGSGGGVRLLPGDGAPSALSRDGTQVVYVKRTGSDGDVMLLDRRTGAVKQITSSSINEVGPEITPDGKAVIYRQRRNIRRIAIADVSKLLGAK